MKDVRTAFGGPYDSFDARTGTLFEQITEEHRRNLDDGDDLAQARRAEALAVWHAEIADIFEQAEALIRREGGHPLEAAMAHAAAVLHNGKALAASNLAHQHRARLARHFAEGTRRAMADPFARTR